jgi:SpoU rRNA methylase family enzyme
MVRLVEGTVFPAVSFGPISHALCRLVPSSNRTVASYSARALKLLILDDALRSQAIVAGVPSVVCGAIKQWEDEVLCLRELLGALQTLTWDKACVKGVLQADILSSVIDFTQAPDQEVSVLAMATLANVLSYSDTLLLTDTVLVETLATSLPLIMDSLRPFPSSASSSSQHSDSLSRNQSKRHTSQDSLNQSPSTGPQRFYAIASLANASCHPRLAEVIKVNGGLTIPLLPSSITAHQGSS